MLGLFIQKTYRYSNKLQRRFLFLFDGGILFCKKRTQPLPYYAPEYYEHKMCIPMKDLGLYETSRSASERFDIYDGTKNDGYAIQPLEEAAKAKMGSTINIAYNCTRTLSWSTY